MHGRLLESQDSSVAISVRYARPSKDAVLAAMSWLGGHKI
jgi:hypothetical protein